MNILQSGALKSPEDTRDWQLGLISSSPAPIIWGQALDRPEPPDTNQRTSDCCVGEAWSNFHWILTGTKFAVRSIFAYIALPYGAYGRDGGSQIVNKGQQWFITIPDPDPKTPQNMRSKNGLDEADALKNKETGYFTLTSMNINQVAQAIRDWRGCVFRLEVSNEGWADLTNPRPPIFGEDSNGHYVCGFDYHLHGGVKCIIAKSSFCGSQPGHHVHHIKESYFTSFNASDPYVLVPRSLMVKRYLVQKGDKLGVLVSADGDGIFADTTFWAKSEAHLTQMKAQYEIPDNAPVIVYP